jgi:hypothetical protein
VNIDEAIEVAGLIAKRGDFWDLTSERQCAIILAAEVKRLREFSEAQRRDNEQLRDRLKVLES